MSPISNVLGPENIPKDVADKFLYPAISKRRSVRERTEFFPVPILSFPESIKLTFSSHLVPYKGPPTRKGQRTCGWFKRGVTLGGHAEQ